MDTEKSDLTIRDLNISYSESDLPSQVHSLNTIIFRSFGMTNFCPKAR